VKYIERRESERERERERGRRESEGDRGSTPDKQVE
jgi:hypothetical protein